MSDPITDTQLKKLMDDLLIHYNHLTKRIVYGRSLAAKNIGIPYVETTLMENAQAHIGEAAAAVGRIILNRGSTK